MMIRLHRVSLVLFFLTLPLLITAGTSGKIAGTVVDAESNDPLPGVNIVLKGTTMGAAADVNGEYVILNVPPGIYAIEARMIGYQT
ncbi:carboxypeptidase-like regulatory domain-containing protein, partial [candidate division KSB1 bacterium]|nr:carboxypeptidase-like regulatory domain-containing protein [candidate division KSB1 bacterium]